MTLTVLFVPSWKGQSSLLVEEKHCTDKDVTQSVLDQGFTVEGVVLLHHRMIMHDGRLGLSPSLASATLVENRVSIRV